MERDLWRLIVLSLRPARDRRPRCAVYSYENVLAVLFWAALHDRPISWACKRENWPVQAWRRKLPSQSAMSRRLRDPEVLVWINRVLHRLQELLASTGQTLVVDGKAFAVGRHSKDPDAARGWGTGRYERGYKLHVLVDGQEKLLAWDVQPLNVAESSVARDLVRRSRIPDKAAFLLGDASYDKNPLFTVARWRGLQLVAPRRIPGARLGHRKHDPSRLTSIAFLEQCDPKPDWFAARRDDVERFFGSLASFGAGLSHLPSWVRRLHRCRVWIGAKLVVNAARTLRRSATNA